MSCCPKGTDMYSACFKGFLLVVRSKKISSDSGLLDHPVDDSEDTLVKAWHMQMYPKWCTHQVIVVCVVMYGCGMP